MTPRRIFFVGSFLTLANVSAMSYGALSKNAILALNKGAKLGGFAHNTGTRTSARPASPRKTPTSSRASSSRTRPCA